MNQSLPVKLHSKEMETKVCQFASSSQRSDRQYVYWQLCMSHHFSPALPALPHLRISTFIMQGVFSFYPLYCHNKKQTGYL